MATNSIKLVINRQAKTLVQYKGSASVLPSLHQGNVVEFEVSVVDPGTTQLAAFTPVDLAAYGLRLAITPTPTGTAGGPTALARTIETGWSWDATNLKFTGSLDLSPALVDSYLGADASKAANFELTLTKAGNRSTLFQDSVILKAVGDEGVSLTTLPAEEAISKSTAYNDFQKRVGDNGQRLKLYSPDGSKAVELGISNEGIFITNIITI